MVDVIIYIILCIISFSIGAYQTRKAYTLGLKHNYELKNNIKPTENVNPIIKVMEEKKEAKQEQQQESILNEWLNGE